MTARTGFPGLPNEGGTPRNVAEVVNQILRRIPMQAGISTMGNTAGTTSLVQKQLVFVATNGITLSQSNSGQSATLTIVGPGAAAAFSAGVSTFGNTAGSTGITGTRVVFVGTNNITLSQSTDANGATISISGQSPAGGAFSAGVSTGGNTLGSTGITGTRMVFAGGNNVTLSQSTDANGGTITVSAFNQTVQTQSLFSAGVSTMGNTAGSTGITGTRLVLVGTNGISLSQSTDANGGTVSINFTQSAESQSIGASNLGNTLGTSGVASGAQVRAIIIGTSNITVSQSVNGASATLSLIGQPSFSGGVSNLGNTAGSTGVSGTRMVLVGTNGITLSQSTDANGNTISFSAGGGGGGSFSAGISNLGNTAGSTGISGTRMVLAGTNLISLSQSTDANGNTVSINYTQQTQSFWMPGPSGGFSSTATGGNGSVSVFPAMPVYGFVSGSRADFFASMSISSSSNSSHAGAVSAYIGIYTRNASTLSLASSGSQSYQWSNTSSNSVNSLTDFRRFSVPININVTPGDYWVAVMSRTSTTNANWFTGRPLIMSGPTNRLNGLIGETTNSTMQLMPGWGVWTASSTALPASIALSNLVGIGSLGQNHWYPLAYFVNVTA